MNELLMGKLFWSNGLMGKSATRGHYFAKRPGVIAVAWQPSCLFYRGEEILPAH
jgi:hypothetical protein